MNNKQKALISVIVPVYKVEKYLNQCVESIISQTYQNLEIILIDDGSPDLCPSMCDSWAKKDGRIQVVHKTNGGSAQARNVALDIAKGDYIAFVDSDDMINGNMLSILYDVANEQNADIVECDYSINQEKLDNSFDVSQMIICDSKEAMLQNVQDNLFRQVIWNKIYKASTIGSVRFAEGKTIDDEFWTYKVIGNADKLVHIKSKLYYYRQQDESVMHQKYSLKRLAGVEAHVERHNYICSKFSDVYVRSLVQLWLDCRYHGQMVLLNLNGKEEKEAFEYLENILKTFPLSYKIILQQELKERIWLLIEKLSLKLVCKLRNSMHKGL